MVPESDCDASSNWHALHSHHMINIGLGWFENNRKCGDYPNYSIIKIGQNTKKSPGDLRILVVPQLFF